MPNTTRHTPNNGKYVIVRIFLSQRRRRIVKRGLSLAKAKAHIASPKARGTSPSLYIDGYRAA